LITAAIGGPFDAVAGDEAPGPAPARAKKEGHGTLRLALMATGFAVGHHEALGPGLGIGWSRESLRIEGGVEGGSALVSGGASSLGVRAGWVLGAPDASVRMPILVGWRFSDGSNDCYEGCDRAMVHAVTVDVSVAFAMGSTAELVVGGFGGLPIASAVWRSGTRTDEVFGGAGVRGLFLGVAWDLPL